MKMIVPMPITDSVLTASNLAEHDAYSAWSGATTYAAGDFAWSATTHRLYRSVQGSNTNNDPTTDDGTWWVDYSATNRWKGFDQTIADRAESAGDIEYTFVADRKCTHVALFGLSASGATIVIKEGSLNTIYTQSINLTDTSMIVSWYTYFTEEITYETELIFENLPIFVGYTVELTIGDGSGPSEVGQVIVGKMHDLGTTLDGTEVGFRDFSIKEQDEFGNLTITQRGYADTAEFQFKLPTTNVRAVKRVLTQNRATPCVFFADSGMLDTGTVIFGFAEDMSFPLGAGGTTFATLDITGLV